MPCAAHGKEDYGSGVHYVFHFNVVWDHWRDLAGGAWLTIQLSSLAMVIGLALATVCAYAKAAGPSAVRWTVATYVEVVRNTPFLVQIFIIYFSLPVLGISVGANEAALAAMVVNFGAYGTEILRAGIESVSHGQVDAAKALGLTRLQTFRYVVLFPALKTVFPGTGEPIHPADARFKRRVRGLRGRAHRRYQFAAIDHLPSVRILFRRDRTVSGHGTGLSRCPGRNLLGRLRARATLLEAPGVNRSFGIPEFIYLLAALRWTLLLSLVAFLGGGVVGFVIAILRTTHSRILRLLTAGYIQLFQGTPVLMQLFLFYYGLAVLYDMQVDAWPAVALAFTLYAGAFLGEIWRGSIQAIPRTQWEASACLSLGYIEQLRFVILPQAMRISIPPTVGFLVQLVKGTSIAAIIGFVELTRAGQLIVNVTFQPMVVYPIVAALYFAVCWPLSLAQPIS